EAQGRRAEVPGLARGALPLTLADKVAVVTGASRGLGRAIAVALAGAGADVALAARSKEDLEETARRVQAAGRRALVVPTDVASYTEVEALMARAVRELGRLDIVVNNSGVAKVAPLAEMTAADPRINERLTRDIPMRRIGRPEEIGPLAVFLASSASDFMTGQTIFLDGGHSAA